MPARTEEAMPRKPKPGSKPKKSPKRKPSPHGHPAAEKGPVSPRWGAPTNLRPGGPMADRRTRRRRTRAAEERADLELEVESG